MSHKERLDNLEDALEEHLEDFSSCEWSRTRNEVTLVLSRDELLPVMRELRSRRDLAFETCIDVCGVDYSTYGQSEWVTDKAPHTGFGRGAEFEKIETDPANRFAVVYHLLSVSLNHRLRVKVFLDADSPVVDSVVDIWSGANWFEREAFDLFGIMFSGHPDLRRILTDYGFVGHPFRKDFPLIGQVEMRYDPESRRVIYQPVSIEQRVLVPRVIRGDSRYESAAPVESENADVESDG